MGERQDGISVLVNLPPQGSTGSPRPSWQLGVVDPVAGNGAPSLDGLMHFWYPANTSLSPEAISESPYSAWHSTRHWESEDRGRVAKTLPWPVAASYPVRSQWRGDSLGRSLVQSLGWCRAVLSYPASLVVSVLPCCPDLGLDSQRQNLSGTRLPGSPASPLSH